ncbi:MAG TPA: sialidase family protein [Actinomycetota bacterium]|nr:sialidase family protein [Actinomycetota bacterium]
MTRRNNAVALVCVLGMACAVTFDAPARSAVAAAPPACQSADFSPVFAADGKGFCVAFDPSDGEASTFRFFSTDDGGRTWVRRPAAGWTTTADDFIGSVIVSPGYETDRTVFVQSSNGVFATTDDGESFSLLDNIATPGPSGPNLSAYVDDSVTPASPSGSPRPVLALAAGDSSMKIDPPLRIPVAGAPLDERRFLFPTGGAGEWSAYTITREADSAAARSRNVLFACDEQLVCNEQLAVFPWGYQFEPRGGIWFAPDFERSRGVYVTASKFMEPSDQRAWRSTDGGATFVPWRSVNRLVRPLRDIEKSNPTVGLATHPSRPRTMYMRVGYTASQSADIEDAPPVERFFVSRDRGRTWTRVSHRRSDTQNGSRGTIPWDGAWGYPVSNYVSVMADGTLFVMARAVGGYEGLYCSTDGGRTWAPACARS